MFYSIVHTCVVYTVFTKNINFITELFLKNKDFYHLKKNNQTSLFTSLFPEEKKLLMTFLQVRLIEGNWGLRVLKVAEKNKRINPSIFLVFQYYEIWTSKMKKNPVNYRITKLCQDLSNVLFLFRILFRKIVLLMSLCTCKYTCIMTTVMCFTHNTST